MTVIRWVDPANADFLNIVEVLTSKNPSAAARVGRQILDTVEMLLDHAYLGKPGRSPDTRELGVARFPYLVVYSVALGEAASDAVQVTILRVLHGAMMWPPEDDQIT